MKLLIRDYLAALKEREELDAVLPDLLSELGFNVLSRPRRGTQQRGVDIAAIGPDDDGERKLFLFSVKQGDLTRQDWDNGTPQALRPSLSEILDGYIRNRIPARYKSLRIVICIALGGEIHEQVRELVTGYIDEHTTNRITFAEWNGDEIASRILQGVLREKILPRPFRSSFQKSVAMVDEPDVAYEHFAVLSRALRAFGATSDRARLRAARQINICLWILFVWARDAGNVEAPYRASELALLCVWELVRPTTGRKSKHANDIAHVLQQVVNLHLAIAAELLERRILPYATVRHGVSIAVGSRNAVDVNLALFEVLGRIGLAGIWVKWIEERTGKGSVKGQNGVAWFAEAGLALINSNPELLLPITDRQGTDVAMFLVLWLHSGLDCGPVAAWIAEMAKRIDLSTRWRGRYPCMGSRYQDLIEHPRNNSDEYFNETTAGSTLIPLVAAWLQGFQVLDVGDGLARLAREKLAHCTFQLWIPDEATENGLYVGEDMHGRALCDLPVGDGGVRLLDTIAEACRANTEIEGLSAVQCGLWPLVLVACRHYRLPVPPHFWIRAFATPPANEGAPA